MNKTSIGIFYIDRAHKEQEDAQLLKKKTQEEQEEEPDTSKCDDPCLGIFSGLFFGLVRRLAQFYLNRQEWVHLEIAFFDPELQEDGKCVAFKMVNEGLFRVERNFDRAYYHWIILDLKEERLVRRVRDFCEDAFRKGTRFDMWGSWWVPVWPRRPLPGHYWCIAFVVDALQQAGILKGYRSETLDVDDVVELLHAHPCHQHFALTPHKRKQIKERTETLSLQQVLSK